MQLRDDVTPGSLIVYRGREAEVIAINRGDGGGLNVPSHLEVMCT
jgi:hypothetical protein